MPRSTKEDTMTIEKLERVMWRLTNTKTDYYLNQELERAIMYEIGTDIRTYKANRKRLIKLGWIRSKGNKRITVTGKHLSEA
jgi:hypothetical protein